ncbi:hypothetical protein ES695_19635 [Candidatus Atribacteria bacterium 1244-E10-H5-B2]|nr:MAG: hypothetical protein ES695_19635 [Candidatus Atribacteria bacterium 1244-E10-H5-B2]
MSGKVSTKEIEKIKERLKAELEDKDLPFQRKEEVESLIIHLDTWLEWRAYGERKRYREIIQSES